MLFLTYFWRNPDSMGKTIPQSTYPHKNASADLTDRIVRACQSAKGIDIAVLDMEGVFDMTDYFIVVSGRSDRHTQGIGNKLISELQQQGIKPETVEGFDDGHWILIDFCDVVVHIFYEPVRSHYDIEGLWIHAKRLPVSEDEDLKAA